MSKFAKWFLFGVVAMLTYWFIVKPLFLDPKIIDTSYSHFHGSILQIKEMDVQSDQSTIYYTLEMGGQIYKTVIPGNAGPLSDILAKQGANVRVLPPPKPSSMVTMLLIGTLPVLLLIGAMFWIAKKNSGSILEFTKMKDSQINPEDNKTRLTDVIANPGEHEEAAEIVAFIKERGRFHAAKAKIPKGVLLCGPPGTGKTLLAKAIAGEAGVPFFSISGSEFVEMFVGVGAGRVRDLFNRAKAAAPSIIFIDEIDAVGRARGGSSIGGGTREADQTLNQLLTEMDGFTKETGVTVIAATNMSEVLDGALTRPGRFDRTVHVGLPDINCREQMFDLYLKKVNPGPNIDCSKLARGTAGMSGAEIEQVVSEGSIFAARDGRMYTEQEDLERALDKVIMGAETKKPLSLKERWKTAYHEAGHAIVGRLTPGHDPVHKVSIMPRGRALGITQFLPEDDKYSHDLKELSAFLSSLYGGRIAEELEYGAMGITTGASNDIERATALAHSMVERWGYSSLGAKNLARKDHFGSTTNSQSLQSQIEEAVDELLLTAQKNARNLLSNNKDKLDLMALALVQHETIGVEVIDEIMEGTYEPGDNVPEKLSSNS